MEITGLTNILIEWVLFLISTTMLFKTKDAWSLFQEHPSNMILAVPVLTVFLPTLLSFPLYVPSELVIPHLVYMVLFAVSILVDLRAIFTRI